MSSTAGVWDNNVPLLSILEFALAEGKIPKHEPVTVRCDEVNGGTDFDRKLHHARIRRLTPINSDYGIDTLDLDDITRSVGFVYKVYSQNRKRWFTKNPAENKWVELPTTHQKDEADFTLSFNSDIVSGNF